uniref:Uncharacterized protein n=1 Tax=Mammaliicoccus phage MSShimriz1 TaxID=3230127 RepID=A0AAU8GSW6_9VIRU
MNSQVSFMYPPGQLNAGGNSYANHLLRKPKTL